ncbi:MAG TPA: cupin domain-containing protein [Pseudolabrys sp.]|nr:cupin domain-containing protein [Pseudolabrys sp.]
MKADSAGESHIEQATLELNEADYRPPAPMLFVSHSFQADGLQFVRLPSGWIGDSIHPPKAQFLICLKGHLEMTVSDGHKRTFGPGDCILMEDISGKGHRTHVKGDEECLAAVIPIAAH